MSTPLDIRAWFNNGRLLEASYMLVVYDSLNGVDYPVYVDEQHIERAIAETRQAPMQRIMELYNLNEDRNTQLNEERTWRLPSDSDTGRDSDTD